MNGRIFVTGDVHYPIDSGKLFTLRYDHDLCSSDILIVCGDFGVTWYGRGSQRDESVKQQISRLEYTVLFVDGNHENHPDLAQYPIISKFGAQVHQITNNCFHLMRGQIYTLAGKTFFTMGGAHSIDRRFRTAGVSWWPEEEPNQIELQTGLDTLKRVKNKVDYIITHDCPSSIYNLQYDGVQEQQLLPDYFENLSRTTEFDGWFFGHHHRNFIIDKASTEFYSIASIEHRFSDNGTFVGLYNCVLQIQPSLQLVHYQD